MVLKLELSSGDASAASSDTLVIGVFQGQVDSHPSVLSVDRALGGGLLEHAKAVEFDGKSDQTLDIATLGKLKARRLLVLGAGEEQKFDAARLRSFVASAMRAALGSQVRTVALVLPRDHSDARTVGEGVGLGCYRFTKYFTGDRKPKTEIGKV